MADLTVAEAQTLLHLTVGNMLITTKEMALSDASVDRLHKASDALIAAVRREEREKVLVEVATRVARHM